MYVATHACFVFQTANQFYQLCIYNVCAHVVCGFFSQCNEPLWVSSVHHSGEGQYSPAWLPPLYGPPYLDTSYYNSTPSGPILFPPLIISIKGLNPAETYKVSLHVVPTDTGDFWMKQQVDFTLTMWMLIPINSASRASPVQPLSTSPSWTVKIYYGRNSLTRLATLLMLYSTTLLRL